MEINDANFTAASLAKKCGGRLIGDGSLRITGANEIHHVVAGDLCFVDFHKYYDSTLASAASIILIDQERPCPSGKALIVVDQPFEIYNKVVAEYRGAPSTNPAPLKELGYFVSLKIGENTVVETGAHLSANVTIGNDCRIFAGAFIGEHTIIGNGVIVHPGAIVGSDSFYFKNTPAGRIPWVSGGRVVLEDRVEIGPNCNIAKGVSSDTIIGAGSKLDALVQIGHDCKLGPNCLLAAQVGIAGNCTIGEGCILYGQAGVAQNIKIGPKAVIQAQSGVGEDLEGGKEYFGSPCQEKRIAFREIIALRRLAKGRK